MFKIRSRSRKSKPKSRDSIIEQKRNFSKRAPDLLLETIGSLIGDTSCDKRSVPIPSGRGAPLTCLTRKRRTQSDPKMFFEGTVFQDMFYPPRTSVVEDFLNHSSTASNSMNSEVDKITPDSDSGIIQITTVKERAASNDQHSAIRAEDCNLSNSQNVTHEGNSMTVSSEREDTVEIITVTSTASSETSDEEVLNSSVRTNVARKSGRMLARRVPVVTPYSKPVKVIPKSVPIVKAAMRLIETTKRQDAVKSSNAESACASSSNYTEIKESVYQKGQSVQKPLLMGLAFLEKVRANIAKHLEERGIVLGSGSEAPPIQPPNQECIVSSSTEPTVYSNCILLEDSDSVSIVSVSDDNERAGLHEVENVDEVVVISD